MLAARNGDKLAIVTKECQGAGADAIAVSTDVADDAACRALIEAAVSHYGAIDGLVTNAGTSMISRVDAREGVAGRERLRHVHYLGAAYCTYQVLPPSTVTQAARSSSSTGAIGDRLGTAHVIVLMLTSTNKGGGWHTNTSRNVRRRVASPACIAGVRTSRPNLNAPCGRMKL